MCIASHDESLGCYWLCNLLHNTLILFIGVGMTRVLFLRVKNVSLLVIKTFFWLVYILFFVSNRIILTVIIQLDLQVNL